ncbi:MAG: MmgE/PrpD family protein [Rhodospirillaceae bacterium]|nr:MmgE/PrpD family protein [Rhodospirillaceae bacterium]
MSSVEPLVAHIARTTFDDLPAAAVTAAKIFVLDTFSCAMAGSTGPSTAEALAAAQAWGRGDDATVWAHGVKLPGPSAALINAYQIHCLEFDCVHEGSVIHPMSSLMSALLAEAERQTRATGRRFSGREMIAAIVLGIDVACSIGVCSKAPMRFFRPAAIGGFGAATACAKLRGFDKAQIWNTLGIMYGQTSGTMQAHVEGSKLLGLQVGFAARGALVACDLAAAGIEGPKDVISGQWGYLPLFEGDYDLQPAWSQFGKVWRVCEVGHKPFPSGRLTHYAVDALQRMRAAHRFTAEQVAAIEIVCPPLPHRLVGRPDRADATPNYAKLCLGYVCARALIRGTVDPSDFTEDALRDATTHALAGKVRVILDGNPDLNAFGPQTITVTLIDGQRHRLTIDKAIGDPLNPLPRDRQIEKFWRCWDLAARPLPRDRGERLIAAIDRLETVADVTDLVHLVSPPGAGA